MTLTANVLTGTEEVFAMLVNTTQLSRCCLTQHKHDCNGCAVLLGPDDCYIGDGESYRGTVSQTIAGDECLQWNSHFIIENGVDPFKSFQDKDGLGPHNSCRSLRKCERVYKPRHKRRGTLTGFVWRRNPDGEIMPWCFFRRGRKLFWDYCDVLDCSDDTGQLHHVPDCIQLSLDCRSNILQHNEQVNLMRLNKGPINQ